MKQLNSKTTVEEFQKEAETMKYVLYIFRVSYLQRKLRPHPNVTSLLGVCLDPICIVTEYVSNGSLQKLIYDPAFIIDLPRLLNFVSWLFSEITPEIHDTSSGMAHLHAEGILHNDLATRNLLVKTIFSGLTKKVTAEYRIKVADFGLSKVLSSQNEVYDARADTKFPVKWTVPFIFFLD